MLKLYIRVLLIERILFILNIRALTIHSKYYINSSIEGNFEHCYAASLLPDMQFSDRYQSIFTYSRKFDPRQRLLSSHGSQQWLVGNHSAERERDLFTKLNFQMVYLYLSVISICMSVRLSLCMIITMRRSIDKTNTCKQVPAVPKSPPDPASNPHKP